MIGVSFDYATPSAFCSQKDRALLGLAVDANRGVRFHGLVRKESVFLVRTALRALGQAVWSEDSWLGNDLYGILDPIVTVHPDQIFLETFSQDQSVYALLALDRELFQTEGEVRTGTSNVDFTAWLWSALGEMRSSRATWLRLDTVGLEVETVGAGGRFEKKVEVPEHWVAGFLQLQQAMTMPGTRLQVRPVDLLAPIRHLRYAKARMSPRALRYEFEPGQPVRIVLEPWEEVFTLKDTLWDEKRSKIVRTWGRRRLKLLEPLLPFADSVDVFLKGRALPSFYQVRLPGLRFLLGLSGWSGQGWTRRGGFELLSSHQVPDPLSLGKAYEELRTAACLSPRELSLDQSEALLEGLVRRGQAFYDPGEGRYRHRDLFSEPVDLDRLFPPDPRVEAARKLVRDNRVELQDSRPRETRKIKRLPTPRGKELREIIFRDWSLQGRVDGQSEVEVVLNDTGRILFGRCGCAHFQEHLLNQGPCEHMLALREVGQRERPDLPTSVELSEQEGEPS